MVTDIGWDWGSLFSGQGLVVEFQVVVGGWECCRRLGCWDHPRQNGLIAHGAGA